MLAVTNGHANVVQALIEQGAQVDCADKYLCTALHRAVSIYMCVCVACVCISEGLKDNWLVLS